MHAVAISTRVIVMAPRKRTSNDLLVVPTSSLRDLGSGDVYSGKSPTGRPRACFEIHGVPALGHETFAFPFAGRRNIGQFLPRERS